METEDKQYTQRLVDLESRWWRRLLDVQAPYRWNMRRLQPGFVLDVGCGVGRNLRNLGGNGVGVDHNPDSVATARARGFNALTVDQFLQSDYAKGQRFDTLLVSHVLEHMTVEQGVDVLGMYVGYIRPGGRLIAICPQEAGYASDETHVQFADFAVLRKLMPQVGFEPVREFSFPFPRAVGRYFRYNEFVSIGVKK